VAVAEGARLGEGEMAALGSALAEADGTALGGAAVASGEATTAGGAALCTNGAPHAASSTAVSSKLPYRRAERQARSAIVMSNTLWPIQI
jgi:hypothetical protein